MGRKLAIAVLVAGGLGLGAYYYAPARIVAISVAGRSPVCPLSRERCWGHSWQASEAPCMISQHCLPMICVNGNPDVSATVRLARRMIPS